MLVPLFLELWVVKLFTVPVLPLGFVATVNGIYIHSFSRLTQLSHVGRASLHLIRKCLHDWQPNRDFLWALLILFFLESSLAFILAIILKAVGNEQGYKDNELL